MKFFANRFGQLCAVVALCSIFLAGCAGNKTSTSESVKYANPGNPGAKLDIKSVLVPDQMNLLYFYADW